MSKTRWWCLKCKRALEWSEDGEVRDTVRYEETDEGEHIEGQVVHEQCGGRAAWSEREALA